VAGKITHRYENPIAQQAGYGPPAGGVGPDEWNDSLVVSEGTNGEVPTRDSGQTDGWRWQLPYWHGQCRLVLDGANLRLNPFDGNRILINGKSYAIPSAGVALGSGGLAASTTYYIYVFDNSGTLTLEASTTAYAVDSNTGVTVKNGDTTRTLVGMARTSGGTAWVDSATQRFVLSWFNKRQREGHRHFTTDRTTTSTSYVEINSEIRVEFLAWGSDLVHVQVSGSVLVDSNRDFDASIAFDGTTPEDTMNRGEGADSTNNYLPIACEVNREGLSEGYHYATVIGKIEALGGSITFVGSGTPGLRTVISVVVSG
jgi:hypothetical protein